MSEDILPPGSTKVIHYSPEILNVKVIVYMESITLQQEFDLNDRGKLTSGVLYLVYESSVYSNSLKLSHGQSLSKELFPPMRHFSHRYFAS